VTPDAALARLVEGNDRHLRDAPRPRDFAADRASLALGQAPFAAVLGCSDSRVAPELTFDQGPGDLFVVRVAGNFVTDAGLASLEFAVGSLGVRLVLVLGHTGCGAIAATIEAARDGVIPPGHIGELTRAISPAIEPTTDEVGDARPGAVSANVLHNVARLRQAEPILAGLVESGQLRVAGGVYDLETGAVALV
jgi:carbonic anhydrase